MSGDSNTHVDHLLICMLFLFLHAVDHVLPNMFACPWELWGIFFSILHQSSELQQIVKTYISLSLIGQIQAWSGEVLKLTFQVMFSRGPAKHIFVYQALKRLTLPIWYHPYYVLCQLVVLSRGLSVYIQRSENNSRHVRWYLVYNFMNNCRDIQSESQLKRVTTAVFSDVCHL